MNFKTNFLFTFLFFITFLYINKNEVEKYLKNGDVQYIVYNLDFANNKVDSKKMSEKELILLQNYNIGKTYYIEKVISPIENIIILTIFFSVFFMIVQFSFSNLKLKKL